MNLPAKVAAICALLVASLALPARASGEPPEIFAVVIGWNGGNRELPPLRFADDDAARFATFFRGLGSAERPGRVWLLTEFDARTKTTLAEAGLKVEPDGPPTRPVVLATLRTAAAAIGRGGDRRRVLYVIYAGHGLRGRVLLQPTGDGEAALTGTELRTALADALATGARPQEPSVFVFLDACRSESLFADRGAVDFGTAIAELAERAEALPIGVLTAARSGKPAGEVARLEAGFFSHVLGSGLAGGADADGDDVVSFGELAAFVAFHTQKLTGQLPWFDPPNGDLEAGTIDHRGRPTRLVLPAEGGSRFLVSAAVGRPVFAEAFQGAGLRLRLRLPPGSYRVMRESRGQPGRVAHVVLGRGQVVDLTTAAWQDGGGTRGEDPSRNVDFVADNNDSLHLDFSSQLSSEVVSTLAAGFYAGRSEPASPSRLAIAAEIGVAPAPLALPGSESRLALRVVMPIGPFAAALVARGARAAHTVDGRGRTLHHLGLAAELTWPLPLSRTIELGPHLAAGWGLALLSSDRPLAGDLVSPTLDAGLRVSWRLGRQIFLTGLGAVSATFLTVDERIRRSLVPTLAFGAGRLF